LALVLLLLLLELLLLLLVSVHSLGPEMSRDVGEVRWRDLRLGLLNLLLLVLAVLLAAYGEDILAEFNYLIYESLRKCSDKTRAILGEKEHVREARERASTRHASQNRT